MSAESRQAKISRLKNQINHGLYHVDARIVAHAIVLHARRHGCLVSSASDASSQRGLVGRRGVSYCWHERSERYSQAPPSPHTQTQSASPRKSGSVTALAHPLLRLRAPLFEREKTAKPGTHGRH